ncbi:MAG: hypothetical protein FVQ81_11335 [Candidatus Glassbacteria bacterium]|nr:hypothetical protein [Candidatus Glassbacteria bacterium]
MYLFIYSVTLTAAEIEIRGPAAGVNSFWQAGHTLAEHGVNAVFVGSYGINDGLIEKAGPEGAKVFSEFATLNGGRYLKEHPGAWPIVPGADFATSLIAIACGSQPARPGDNHQTGHQHFNSHPG